MQSKFCSNKLFSLSMIVFLMLLSGCVPSRDVIGDFDLIEKGFVGRSNEPAFTACLMPIFRDRAYGFGMINRRQERVDNVLRIENVSVSLGLIVSADIHDDGIVELHRYKYSRDMVEDQRSGFIECLSKFRK